MIPKDLEDIQEADIVALIKDGIYESLILEYKEKLHFQTDDQKKELLADISSFANASGGDIIFGLKAEKDNDNKPTGRAAEITGIDIGNWDEAINSLDNIIINGIQPRIPAVKWQKVDCASRKTILIVRILKSWIAPHMVTLGKSRRFYLRMSAGKYLMEESQIRSAYLRSIGVEDQIKRFRDERLSRIIAGETPVKLERGPKVIVHLFPLSSLDPSFQIDLSRFPNSRHPLSNRDLLDKFKPWRIGDYASGNCNFDGFLISANRQLPVKPSYVQIFRNGSLEYCYCLGHDDVAKNLTEFFEYQLYFGTTLNSYFDGLKTLRINPPVVIMLTLTGVKGFKIIFPQQIRRNFTAINVKEKNMIPIDRDILIIPEVQIDDYEFDIKKIHHSVFDIIWNSVGVDLPPKFNDSGNFIGFV